MRDCILIDKDKNTDENYLIADNPLVSILLAVYKPNDSWFIEQLKSLNDQHYNNLELLVYDDCPSFPISEKYFKRYITKFSYKLVRGSKNQGSNRAFEELTKLANGDLFAYCDQDDIWEKEKIELMVEKFLDKDVTLVCSDLSIIDENGEKIADSITQIRKRHNFKSGYSLAKGLLMSNFVTGCAMMVRKDIAKKAIPFENTLVHDQWISIIAAIHGSISFINRPLVRYRQHSFNQTGILTGIYDKQTYYEIRIQSILNRYMSLKQKLDFNNELKQHINECLIWIKARENYFFKPSIRNLKVMLRYRKIHKVSIFIEIFLPFLPNTVFRYIIKLAQKGVL